MSVESSKDTYVLNEPVLLTYAVTNPTPQAIRSQIYDLAYCYKDVELRIQHESEEPRLLNLGATHCDRFPRGETLHPPNASMHGFVEILYSRTDDGYALMLGQLGGYTVSGRTRVEYLPGATEPLFIEAPKFQLHVIPPRPLDEELIESLGGTGSLLQVLEMRFTEYCAARAEVSCLEDLIQQARRSEKSAYAPYIAYRAASMLAIGRGPGKDGELSWAADAFLDILDRWRGHPVKHLVMQELPMTLHQAGRAREADQWLGRYLEEYGGDDSFGRYLQNTIRGVSLPDEPGDAAASPPSRDR